MANSWVHMRKRLFQRTGIKPLFAHLITHATLTIVPDQAVRGIEAAALSS
jgi:hypothetical protein